MLKIKGKYNSAIVYTNKIEDRAKEEIKTLLDQPFAEGGKIRIMPDCHSGMGCVIGFTADLGEKVIPNLVGVDIACGMFTVNLGKINLDLFQTDEIINKFVPSGFSIHNKKKVEFDEIEKLVCYDSLQNINRIENSIGTLGGGNHFIEINESESGSKFLVIHSGSRNLGHQVAKHYQNIAVNNCKRPCDLQAKKDATIKKHIKEGRESELQLALHLINKTHKNSENNIPAELCYLEGKDRENYLHDMNICQNYAQLNRETIANIILEKLLDKTIVDFNSFHTVHNYIDTDKNIIRKGAISAKKDEIVLIPINMRDGSILAKGKGNKEWNYSAPHGAGRVMGRRQAKRELNLNEFVDIMKDVYTTSVGEDTLDESPLAYKTIDNILDNIEETVKVVEVLKPIYNYKDK